MTDGIPAAPGTDGWFREGPDGFALLAGRCAACGALSFPPRTVPGCPDPACEGLEQSPAPLSTTGTLWSYTDARYQPPPPFVSPSGPYEPFVLAAVELDADGLIVLGQMVGGCTVDEVHVGLPVELVIEPLLETDDAVQLVWKWKPRRADA